MYSSHVRNSVNEKAKLALEIQLLEAEAEQLKRNPNKTKEMKRLSKQLDGLLRDARKRLRKLK